MRLREVWSGALFLTLSAYTLATGDGGEIAPHLVSASLLLLAAAYFILRGREQCNFAYPVLCLFGMTLYGLIQTLFFRQKIVAAGWNGVLFWFTAACITFLAAHLLEEPREAGRFRRLFIVFGTAVCVLDLLEQASQTNKYFWLIPSRYHNVFGPFAYWNNFAEFVELLLPVTLWHGLGTRSANKSYLLCAAIQIASVVGSGSRAGTVLVTLELLAALGLAYARSRNRALLSAAALAVCLTAVFVYSAGSGLLTAKLQANDQLAVRRDIDRSSFAMIRARPLTGWGLGTYVPVYRMFARYDDGTYVNRAHNDWLEWAAEGGVPFSAAMLAVFLWSIRPAIRSGWGLGLIAICLHAVVDYPFGRFGVCGWYFGLLGMLAAFPFNSRLPGRCSSSR